MPAHTVTPREVFEQWLEKQPDTARVVLACDTDRLLTESKALDNPEVTDAHGRTWRLAVFRGDDLRFRFAFRKAAAASRVAIVILGPADPDQHIDVSTIGDILAKQEGQEVLDLSLARYLSRFCPQINFPPVPLRHYKQELLARTGELAGAAKKITARWGKPDDWGRAQVAALTLLANAPHLALDDVWPDAESPATFLAHVLRLLLARPELAGRRAVVLDLAETAALPGIVNHLFWLKPAPEELAAYLVLRAFAGQQKLQNPTAQLAGVGLLPADHDWSQFEKLAPELIQQLEASGDWPAVEEAGAPYLTPKRVEKLLALTGSGSGSLQGLAGLLASTPIAPVRHAVLRQLLMRVAQQPKELGSILAKWAKANACAESPLASTTGTAQRVQAGLNLLWLWQRIEGVLAQPLLAVKQPTELLGSFVEQGCFRLEADLAQLVHLAHEFGDDEVVEAIHGVAFGESGNDLRPAAGSLKDRLRGRLHELDGKLADLIRPSPEAFAKGVWSSATYLRTRLRKRVDELSVGNGEGRVWVLVFDGMRYDTWRLVVRPVLAEHFEVLEDRPLYCVPPSFTTVARTSLLAGAPPSEWKGFQGQPTDQESALAAVNFGFSSAEAKSKFRLLTEAETLQARAKLASAKGEGKLVSVLIYGIADDCHDFHGDLTAFHQKILSDLTGNKAHGVAGIVDDLLRRIQPEDEVVVVSDHGFTELLGDDGAEVKTAEVAAAGRIPKDDVRWRYTVGFRPASAPEAVEVEVKGEKHFLAVGRRWLCREGTKMPDRYSHGGVSLAEMVVPAAALKRVTTKSARASLEGLPESIELGEDQTEELAFQIRNRGTAGIKFTVEVRSNLGEELLKTDGSLNAGETRNLSVTLMGRYREKPLTREMDPAGSLRAVTFRLRHNTLSGEWQEPPGGQVTIPITVKPKPTKLDTNALAGLDNL
jgi:hypothetical protein